MPNDLHLPELSPESFASGLRERIRAHYGGRLPSAGELARALNQADQWRRPVSAETMRRWIRGLSLPELHRVPTLCGWLGCDPAQLFAPADTASAERTGSGAVAVDGVLRATDGRAEAEADTARLREHIDRLLPRLSAAELAALIVLLERRV